MKILTASLAFMLSAGIAQAAEPHITGTYSSLRFGTEDLTGVELTIVFGGSQYYVIAQCSEGAPGVPEVAVAKVSGPNLSFQLSTNTSSGCPSSEFEGTISKQGLTGKFKGTDNWPGFLKRGPSYWQ